MAERKRGMVYLVLSLAALMIAGFLGLGYWTSGSFLEGSESQAKGTHELAGALTMPERERRSKSPTMAPAPAPQREVYRPTSGWVEEGVDWNKMTLNMGGRSGDVAESLEGLQGAETMLSEHDVRERIGTYQQQFMGCYGEALAEDPELNGKVDMRFGIAPDGHMALVQVTDSSLEDKDVEDCLVEKARRWKFPQSSGPMLTRLEMPFEFRAE